MDRSVNWPGFQRWLDEVFDWLQFGWHAVAHVSCADALRVVGLPVKHALHGVQWLRGRTHAANRLRHRRLAAEPAQINLAHLDPVKQELNTKHF